MLSAASMIGFIPTLDAKRAREFYENVAELEFVKDDHFALVFKSGANIIRVVTVREWTPAPFTILGWEVKDIDAAVRTLKARGIEFQRYPWMPQDNLEIWTAPDGSRVAWFTDPDNNVLSISQHAST